MKRILSILLAAGSVLSVSCNKSISPIVSDNSAPLVLSVELPSSIQTKAFADGTKAVKLLYATYTSEGKLIASESNTTDGVKVDNKKATVSLNLVKGVDYKVVFWAQYPDNFQYQFSWDGPSPTMTVIYKDERANEDTYRDAFYAVRDINTATLTDEDKVIRLYRPFAQINFGASDYDPIVAYYDKETVDKGMYSGLTISADVPNKLNLLDGTVSNYVEVVFNPTNIPGGDDETLVVNKKEYRYVSMNYILATAVPDDAQAESALLKEIVADFTLYVNDENGKPVQRMATSVKVDNVPYLRNHRTNIVGNFFTEDTELSIVVEPGFTDDFIREL